MKGFLFKFRHIYYLLLFSIPILAIFFMSDRYLSAGVNGNGIFHLIIPLFLLALSIIVNFYFLINIRTIRNKVSVHLKNTGSRMSSAVRNSKLKNLFFTELSDFFVQNDRFISDCRKLIDKMSVDLESVLRQNEESREVLNNVILGSDFEGYDESKSHIPYGMLKLGDYIQILLDDVEKQHSFANMTVEGLQKMIATSSGINDLSGKIISSNNDVKNVLSVMIETFRRFVDNIDVSDKFVKEANMNLRDLIAFSGNIHEIVNGINELADKTNLLALNAAIEAARAGESGKGFSIIAKEIGILADKINSETNEINTILEEIIKKADEASVTENKISSSLDGNLKIIDELHENVDRLIDVSDKNDKNVRDISNISVSQVEASDEMKIFLGSIISNSVQIKDSVLSTSSITEDISIILQYKLEALSEITKTVQVVLGSMYDIRGQ